MSTQQFQADLKEYYRLHEDLKDLKKRRDHLKDNILNFVKTHNLEKKRFVLGSSVIRYGRTVSKEGLSQKLILEGLTDFLKDQTVAAKALNFILDKRADRAAKENMVIEKKKK